MSGKSVSILVGLVLGVTNACSSSSASNDGGGGGGGGGAGAGAGGGACQAVLALDRSCSTDTDCFPGVHQTNCCQDHHFVGFRTSAQPQYQDLEAKCEASYPRCGCGEGPPTTDDGSKIGFSATPGIACVQGVCTTFAPDCGKPCGSGTTCFSCSSHGQLFAACTTMCKGSADCQDPTLPMCQSGTSAATSGMFCTAGGVACEAPTGAGGSGGPAGVAGAGGA